jgi:hypothetical protein
MRTYGRDENGQWTVITDPDNVMLTTLQQVLKLQLGEAPFFSSYGIPAQRSVLQQIAPDAYVRSTQARFSPYFATLMVSRVQNTENPTYNVTVRFKNGKLPDKVYQ